MRIIKKRAVAWLIDIFLYATVFVMLFKYVTNLFGDKATIFYYILLIPFLAKDLVFKNCSFGKRIMGISIYKADWKKPTPAELFVRSLFTMVFSYIIFLKAITLGDGPIEVLDWELNKLKMIVVENKTYNKMKEVSLKKGGKFEKEMTIQYEQYVHSLCNK